jgi:superfamily I DNA/RNA helicase
VPDSRSEVELVARFIRGATRDLRLTIGSGAVIVPDSIAGNSLANALETYGIPAAFLTSQNFKLDNNVVAVLPMTSAKGLEFPVVAVAGFTRTTQWPRLDGLDDDAEIEELLKTRRRMFVAMTRAMRALLVVTPDEDDSMLFDGFESTLWNSAD